jgi:hypothetical protein
MKRTLCCIILGLTLALAPGRSPSKVAAASMFSNWSAPINLGPVVNTTFNDFGPAISKDGLSLYLATDRPGGFGPTDIYVSQRDSIDAPWGTPVNLGPTINTSFGERTPNFSRDGHRMFFVSDRPGGLGGDDIWVARRDHVHDDFDWQAPVNLGPGVNSADFDAGATFFQNEEGGTPLLFFGSIRPGGLGASDIHVSAEIADGQFVGATPVPELSSPQSDQRPTIRFDGLEIIWFSARAGSLGGADLWSSTRETVFDSWSPPVNLGPVVNSTSNDAPAYLSSDGRMLLFTSNRPGGLGGLDLYVTTRERVARR